MTSIQPGESTTMVEPDAGEIRDRVWTILLRLYGIRGYTIQKDGLGMPTRNNPFGWLSTREQKRYFIEEVRRRYGICKKHRVRTRYIQPNSFGQAASMKQLKQHLESIHPETIQMSPEEEQQLRTDKRQIDEIRQLIAANDQQLDHAAACMAVWRVLQADNHVDNVDFAAPAALVVDPSTVPVMEQPALQQPHARVESDRQELPLPMPSQFSPPLYSSGPDFSIQLPPSTEGQGLTMDGSSLPEEGVLDVLRVFHGTTISENDNDGGDGDDNDSTSRCVVSTTGGRSSNASRNTGLTTSLLGGTCNSSLEESTFSLGASCRRFAKRLRLNTGNYAGYSRTNTDIDVLDAARPASYDSLEGSSGIEQGILLSASETVMFDAVPENPVTVANRQVGHSALHAACLANNTRQAKWLIRHGANVNDKDDAGQTPLHFASRDGSVGMVNVLLDGGADIDAQDNNNDTPLHLATTMDFENEAIVSVLLANKASVRIRNNTGETALHTAATFVDEKETVQALVQHGANVHATEDRGRTALHGASFDNYLEVIKTLVENGAHVSALDNDNTTALHIVCMNGHTATARYLIEQGAPTNASRRNGWTALHLACLCGHYEIVQLLLDNQAAWDVREGHGWTASGIARQMGHARLADLLGRRMNSDQPETGFCPPNTCPADYLYQIGKFE